MQEAYRTYRRMLNIYGVDIVARNNTDILINKKDINNLFAHIGFDI